MVASLGVEPRWASPVDFESTASTSSATRPRNARSPQAVPRCGYDTCNRYEILSRLWPAGGAAHPARRQPAARGVHRLRRAFITRTRASSSAACPNGRAASCCAGARSMPRRGYWTTPAGFLENGETLQAAAARESLEEAEARVEVGSLLSITHVLHAAQVHVNFRARLLDGTLRRRRREPRGRAVRRGARFPGIEIAFPSIDFALRCYFEDRSAGARVAAFQRYRAAARQAEPAA